MRICFLASDLSLPGAGMQLAQIAAAAKEEGHETTVISLGGTGAPGEWLAAKGVAVRAFNSQSWRLPLALAKFAGATISARPDILQTWGFKANIAGKALGFFCGAKATVSSLRSPESPRRMEAERIASFLCAKTVASSAWLANAGALCGISKAQIETIPNCVDAAAIPRKDRRKPAKDAKWKIIFLGARTPSSGMPLMVSAVAGLAKAGMPIKAVFAGASDKALDAEMQRHLDANGIATKVELKGQLGQEALRKLMEDAHILAAPNVFDWTPNIILEAFASGLPVVAANIEGVRELVIEGKTGRLCVPMDATSLAKGIADAAMEYETSTLRMAREARKLAVERHSPQAMAKAYLDLYKSLAQAPQGR